MHYCIWSNTDPETLSIPHATQVSIPFYVESEIWNAQSVTERWKLLKAGKMVNDQKNLACFISLLVTKKGGFKAKHKHRRLLEASSPDRHSCIFQRKLFPFSFLLPFIYNYSEQVSSSLHASSPNFVRSSNRLQMHNWHVLKNIMLRLAS